MATGLWSLILGAALSQTPGLSPREAVSRWTVPDLAPQARRLDLARDADWSASSGSRPELHLWFTPAPRAPFGRHFFAATADDLFVLNLEHSQVPGETTVIYRAP